MSADLTTSPAPAPAAPGPEAPAAPARSAVARAWARTRHFRPVLIMLVVMTVGFAVTQDRFFTRVNVENLLSVASILWVVSMGMTFVLVSGGFDLSVGATAAFVGIFMAKVLGIGIPGGVVLALMIVVGALIGGVLNGLLIGRLNLSVFVVTLATMIAVTGVVNVWSHTESFIVGAPVAEQIAVNKLLGIPMPIWIMAAVFLVALYVQTRTYFGRDVYAVGGSAIAARLAGIRTARTLFVVYAIAGACAALAGAIGVGRVGAATPQVDTTLPLQAIAAVLLGGTALTGGSGGVGGTALGVLFIAVLQNGLSVSGVASDWQNVVTGVILVVAVLGDRVRFGGGAARLRVRMGRRAAPEPAAGLAPDGT
ncbi:MAG: ribose transport system permease protein [Solirubrobacteraceae bacterium]|nr:ribose transport system permease protein [Solirubrobacteraceae bacterium]